METTTRYPKLNVKLIDKILETIRQDRRRWYQPAWRKPLNQVKPPTGSAAATAARDCNSSFCIAGWAAELDHGRWVSSPGEVLNQYLVARKSDPKEYVEGDLDSKPVIHVRHRAQAVLGLTNFEANELFCGGNNLREVKHIVRDLKRKRGLPV